MVNVSQTCTLTRMFRPKDLPLLDPTWPICLTYTQTYPWYIQNEINNYKLHLYIDGTPLPCCSICKLTILYIFPFSFPLQYYLFLSFSKNGRCLGFQERGIWPDARFLGSAQGASSYSQQRCHWLVCSPWAQALGARVGEVLRRPGPPSVPQTIHATPHLPPEGFQQVQVHAHVRYRREKSQRVRS